MKEFAILIIALVLGVLAHDSDLVRQCNERGYMNPLLSSSMYECKRINHDQ